MSEPTLIKYSIKNSQRFPGCNINNIKQQSHGMLYPPADGFSISIWLEFGKSRLTKVDIHHQGVLKVELIFRLETIQLHRNQIISQNFMDGHDQASLYKIPEDISPLICDELNIKLLNQLKVETKMGIKFVKLTGMPIEVKSSPPKNLSVDSQFKPSKSEQKKIQASKPYQRHIFRDRGIDSKRKQPIKQATGQLSLKDALRQQRRETEEQQLQKALKLSMQSAEKDEIIRSLVVPDDIECLSSKTEMIETELIEKPQLDYKYNRSKLEPWQVQLISELTEQYKQLQQVRQLELNIKEEDRISNYIPGSQAQPFDGTTLAISGFQGKDREEIKQMGLKLGMKYSNELCDNCILVANFRVQKVENASKYKNVTIVRREYIEECHRRKKKLPFSNYLFILDK